MRMIGLVLALALAAPAASANPVDSKDARKMLFGTGSAAFLDREKYLDAAVAKSLKQAAAQIPYYGAIAVSPNEPASSNLMATVANFHSPDAARKAALADCNARRTVGDPCLVIATIIPKRFKERPLTLSVEATNYFNKTFRKLDSPKALAISPTTGVFGADRGDGGRAIAQCNAAAKAKGASDCQIVIAD